jgi:TonB family protein
MDGMISRRGTFGRILLAVFGIGMSSCMTAQIGPIKRAHMAVDLGYYDLALAQLASAEKHTELSEKQKFEIMYLKARSHEGLGKVTDAIRMYQSIENTFPKGPYGYLASEKLRHLQGSDQASVEPLASTNSVEASVPSESLNSSPQKTIATRDDPAYRNYCSDVAKKIDSFWNYPCVKTAGNSDCDFKNAQTTVEIYVARDGNLSSISILKKSGMPIYDFHAIEAIAFAAPFGVMPIDLHPDASSIRVRINFEYHDNRTLSVP